MKSITNIEKIFKDSIKFLNNTGSVISLGGGGFLNKEIRKKTLLKSKTFWLSWNSSTLINRIQRNKKRPIPLTLNNKQLQNLIMEIIIQR